MLKRRTMTNTLEPAATSPAPRHLRSAVPPIGVQAVGAAEIAAEWVEQAKRALEHARENGTLTDQMSAEYRVELCQAVVDSIEAGEQRTATWLRSPEHLDAVGRLHHLESEGLASVHAELDRAVDALLALRPLVQEFNAELREATRRARAGEPGMDVSGMAMVTSGHEVDFLAYAISRLRQAQR